MTFNRAALRDLLEYTEFTWASYERMLGGLPDGSLTRVIDTAGHSTLGHGLFHLASAWDGWLKEHAPTHVAFPSGDEDVTRGDWQLIQQYRSVTRSVLGHIVETMSDDELASVSQDLWPDEGGQPRFHASPAEVIAHILLHERGHHGDITTMFTALGAEPPPSDYLIYLFFRRRQ